MQNFTSNEIVISFNVIFSLLPLQLRNVLYIVIGLFILNAVMTTKKQMLFSMEAQTSNVADIVVATTLTGKLEINLMGNVLASH